MEKKETLHFFEPGKRNTKKIVAHGKKAFEELGLTYVIIATNTGYTARHVIHAFNGLKANIIAITNAKDAQMPVSSLYTKYKSSRILREKYTKEGIKHFPISLSDDTLVELEDKGVTVFFLPDDFGIGGKPRPDVAAKPKRSKLSNFQDFRKRGTSRIFGKSTVKTRQLKNLLNSLTTRRYGPHLKTSLQPKICYPLLLKREPRLLRGG